jgi:UDP-galactopyranose mutase
MSNTKEILIVGAGLTGAVIARELYDSGYKVTVIEKRNHIAGNCYDEDYGNGLYVNLYGGHGFHTQSPRIWNYVNKYSKWNQYNHKIIVNYENQIYSYPINLMTLQQLGYPCQTPKEAKYYLQILSLKYEHPSNFEEKALSLVGYEIYNKFLKGYTEKQWNKQCKDLPASLMGRVPIRFNYDNSYFDDDFQAMPAEGYTKFFENLLKDIPVILKCDYLEDREYWNNKFEKIVFTGCIDAFYSYCLGTLEYRSLLFQNDGEVDLGVATINYTSPEPAYTRKIDFGYYYPKSGKHFTKREYPFTYGEPYYPVGTERNLELYNKYKSIQNERVIFCGRLGSYLYLNIDQAIGQALTISEKIKKEIL